MDSGRRPLSLTPPLPQQETSRSRTPPPPPPRVLPKPTALTVVTTEPVATSSAPVSPPVAAEDPVVVTTPPAPSSVATLNPNEEDEIERRGSITPNQPSAGGESFGARTPQSSLKSINNKSGKQQVKPFTKESLERLENKTVQLVREYGFQPRRKVSVEDGSVLPNKFEPFPRKLYGKPLEEIDNFIYDETFCVVSKRFRKNYIHRFTATKSFFIFSPWNSIRRTCIFVSTNQYFDYVVMATILLNCVFLAMTKPMEEAEYFFLIVYTMEMIIKSVAKGFILNKYTYLRNPWNWLDFVVITSGYATIVMDVGNLAGLRTFRVLRALKTVSIMPGLKTIINALLHSFKQLAEVMTLTVFCLMVFALFALQVYMGELRNKCVLRPPLVLNNGSGTTWTSWITNENNWMRNDENNSVLCGNVTGARHCPADYVCIQVGENPNHGYTNFDNFLWSMLTTFQLITLDYWENVYNMVLATCGPISVSFFTVVVFFGSFYLINLMLAVVALSYEEEAEITQEERRKDLTDHRDDSTFSFDPSKLNVKQLERNKSCKKLDSRKGILLSSYTKKKTRKRKRPKTTNGTTSASATNNEETRSQCPSPRVDASRTRSPSPRDSTSSPRNSQPQSPPHQVLPQRPKALLLPGLAQGPTPPSLRRSPVAPPPPPPPPPMPPDAMPGCSPARRRAAASAAAAAAGNGNANTAPPAEHLHPVLANYGAVLKELRSVLPAKAAAPGTGAGVSAGGPSSNELSAAEVVGIRPRMGRPGSNSDSNNPESSLDDSGVVDDHEGGDVTSEEVVTAHLPNLIQRTTGVSAVVRTGTSPKETTHVIKCNGVSPGHVDDDRLYGTNPDYLSQIVVLDDVMDRNCEKCGSCCIDYDGWLRFQNCLYKIVHDPLFDLMITLCIVLNTMFLAVEHHGMSDNIRHCLDIGNKVFTSIFTLECILKIMAMSKDYFTCGWNIFDLIVVSASLLDLSFELIDGISVLRGMRLLRVLKLAQSWTTMKVLLSIIISTLGALGNLTFVLVIVIYIFAVIGMQLFSKDYTPEKFYPDPVPRWNFSDFFHSFMMIFRILCGEWIEPLWDCMRAESEGGAETCFFIFLPALVMGNFMVLNLFLALLLNSFNSEELKNKKEVDSEEAAARLHEHLGTAAAAWRSCMRRARPYHESPLFMRRLPPPSLAAEEVGEDSKLARSFERLKSIVRRRRAMRQAAAAAARRDSEGSVGSPTLAPPAEYREKSDNEQNTRLEQIVREAISSHQLHQATTPGNVPTTAIERRYALSRRNDSKATTDSNVEESIELEELQSICPSGNHGQHHQHTTLVLQHQQESAAEASGTEDESRPLDASAHPNPKPRAATGKYPWHALVSYVDELTVGGRRDSKGRYTDGLGKFPGFGRDKREKVPQSCFPIHWYERCPCCDTKITTPCGQKWYNFRSAILQVVDTPTFEWIILILIFASSVTLCFEDIYLDENITLKRILYWTNLGFCLLFVVEMLLKWVALGFWKYFTSFWTVLDFIIVFVSVFSLMIEENENLKVLRSLRTLRALRPLRAISRWQGMRIVVNALMYAIPSIFNVLLVCLVFWLIFSIMGVQFFGGKFFHCIDETGERLPSKEVNNKTECFYKNYTWVNSKISFDNVGTAYLALFQVATFEGWMEVMADAVDARDVDLQPEREANIYAYLYFVIFIVCGSFFTLNLFIGVIIDNFNMLKKKYEGGVLEMFLTESQKHYYTAMKKLGRKKPQKVIKRPRNQFLAMFYDLSNSRRFEIAIFVLIFLNMLSMGIEHYNQSHAIFFILEVSNAFFTTVFGLEAIVKIIGLRYHYFTVPWNVFDFVLVLSSILGIVMEDMMVEFPVSPTLLRVVRVFRIGRILRLIKAAKGIRKLLFALVVSLPALFNIGALLALITFIYAIIGMSLFGHVKQQGALNDMVNFTTFGRSMQLLFRLMTSAGWNDVLESLMIQPPDCDPYTYNMPNGNCGQPLLAITYFVSFIIINYMIVINMYIAIILENFNQAHQEEEIGIVEDDLEMFYIRWSKYDPHATQFIGFSQLSDFIASLDPPLGIAKPNTVALVSFNLPIARGNKIHCLDILHSLVKHVLGHVEETDDFRKLREQMDIKFKKQFPTRKELEIVSSTRIWKRQDKAARLIQLTWRQHRRGEVEEVKRKASSKRRPSFRFSIRRLSNSRQGRMQDKDREAVDCEDGETQTSSPGGSSVHLGWKAVKWRNHGSTHNVEEGTVRNTSACIGAVVFSLPLLAVPPVTTFLTNIFKSLATLAAVITGRQHETEADSMDMMANQQPSLVNDSGFAGSSPHPSAGRDSDVDTSPSTSLPGRRHLLSTVIGGDEDDEPHSAVERAMERLQVKIAAFSLERRLVAAAAREQWKAKNDSLNACGDVACRRAAGLLADRVRGLDERLEVCRGELNALGAARNLLMTRKTLESEADSTDGLLGAEPDSLTMTSGDVASRACVQGATPARGGNNNNNNNVLDAAVLLHLERRAHRDTKRQLRELRKRHEILKDELDRLREARVPAAKIITEVENVPPPKDAAREICRLQAALLQLERVRDELMTQNKNLKSKVTELVAARKFESTGHHKAPSDVTEDSSSESNRLRRKSTYKVVHGHKSGLNLSVLEPQQAVNPVKNSLDHDLALAQCRLAAAERALVAREAETRAELARLAADNSRLQEDCNRERVARKRCYSQLQALRGKVRVFCRVRPPSGRLPEDDAVLAASDTYTLSVFAKPGSPSSLRAIPAPNPSPKDYNFDRVFGTTATQEDVFQETSDLLGSVMDGYNVCICAYGQTGTGKTHTILGSPDAPGLAPRVFTRLFELAHEAETRCDVSVSAYVLELYNDRLVDLLRPPDPNARDPVERLEIRRDREGIVWVQGASVTPVGNAEQLQQLFQRALSARRTASTRLNAASSRSHLLIGVRVETSNRLTGSVLRGKVSLLDLAGSERVSRSGAVDEQLREASSINKSLAALGDVISALATDQPFVPYRNSKLTMLLQDSLGGNAKTLMFVTVSPDACDLDETITSLTYATRVRQITNTAKRMAESREIARLKQIIERLKRGERVDPDSPDTSRSDERSTSS